MQRKKSLKTRAVRPQAVLAILCSLTTGEALANVDDLPSKVLIDWCCSLALSAIHIKAADICKAKAPRPELRRHLLSFTEVTAGVGPLAQW